MIDDENAAAGQAGGEGEGASEMAAGAGATVAGDAETLLSGATEGGGEKETEAVAPDWREEDAAGDEKVLSRLRRYASRKNVAKALVETQERLRSGQYVSPLAEDATPEEVAAYRKAAGIPDKPEDYGIAYPEDLKPGEAETELVKAYQERMLSKNISPVAAKEAFAFYTETMKAQREALAEAEKQATLENLADIRKDFPGREYTRSMKMTDEFLRKHFDTPEGLQAINQILGRPVYEGGPPAMHYAPFMKGLFAMARAYADEEALIGGDGAGGGVPIDEEYDALIAENARGPLSASKQARLEKLAEAREARAARGRRAA